MSTKERLQPSLLDRLTDEEPERKQEPRERRALSFGQLRQAVKRDLAWLLNTTNLASVEDLSSHPHATRSVLNFGIPDLTGKAVSGVRVEEIQKLLRQAILDFEPRILPRSLKVRVVVDREGMSHNALRFEIDGELWAEPVPLRMLLQSEIDLETGHVRVEDAASAGGRA